MGIMAFINKLSSTDSAIWSTVRTRRCVFVLWMLLCCLSSSGGQDCTDSVDIWKLGHNQLDHDRMAVYPRLNFTCSGRITTIKARVDKNDQFANFPSFQVWRPYLPGSQSYSKVNEARMQFDSQATVVFRYPFAVIRELTIVLTNNDTIEFQSGDVVGYYHPPNSRYQMRDIQTDGYVLYRFDELSVPDSVRLDNADKMVARRQPMIQFTVDLRCDDIVIPDNGAMSCSSGRPGVGYEGDSCNCTCNAGHELSGSDTRTCLDGGRWSGSEAMCNRVCFAPRNGQIDCGSGLVDRGFSGDNCTFLCDCGYMLEGNVTRRSCQNSGNWSGGLPFCDIRRCSSELNVEGAIFQRNRICSLNYQSRCIATCDEGFVGIDISYMCNVTRSDSAMVAWVPLNGIDRQCKRVTCPIPLDVQHRCSNQAAGVFEETCSFYCSSGYELQGSSNGTCLANRHWSGGDPKCVPLNCTTPPLDNSQFNASCDTHYQSTCTTDCVDGYTGVGGSYTCVVTDGDTNSSVGWDGSTSCRRVECPELAGPINGTVSCLLINGSLPLFEDTCNFTCDLGFELAGSDTRTCQSDRSWSGNDAVCNRVSCPMLSDLVNGFMNCLSGGNYTSGDSCHYACGTGYKLIGSDSRTCLSNGSWNGTEATCERATCPTLVDPANGEMNCSSDDRNISYYEDTCSFLCNRGYKLVGSNRRMCHANGSWSGPPASCVTLYCPVLSLPKNSLLLEPCCNAYQSVCRLQCSEGFTGAGSPLYICELSGEGVMYVNETPFSCTANSSPRVNLFFYLVIGVVGGAILFLIVLLCIITTCCKFSQSRKNKEKLMNMELSSVVVHCKSKEEHYTPSNFQLSANDVVKSEQIDSTHVTPFNYETPESVRYEFANIATGKAVLHDLEGLYEFAEQSYEGRVYMTLCENTDYGPVFTKPPSEVEKIYETFEGKKMCRLSPKDIRTFEDLGSGEFGIVKRGMLSTAAGEVEVAVKTLNPDAGSKDKLRFLQEAAIMCQFEHDNVIKLYGVIKESSDMIVLEYMTRGDLLNFLIALKQLLDEEQIHMKLPLLLLKFSREIAAGMTYLSAKQFVHRDLAARNILLNEKCICKIADFGMSRDLSDQNYYITSGGKIPVKWTAPEALHYKKYSAQSDVWSYGCVLYEVWSLGHKPFETMRNIEVLNKVDNGYRLPPPPGCPRAAYSIMINCWHPDPKSRPQFGQVTKLLADDHLLDWSDEDKQVGSEDSMRLGAPLESAMDLYYDLQLMYKECTS